MLQNSRASFGFGRSGRGIIAADIVEVILLTFAQSLRTHPFLIGIVLGVGLLETANWAAGGEPSPILLSLFPNM